MPDNIIDINTDSGRKRKIASNDIISTKRQFLDKLEIPSEGSKLAQHGNIFQLKLLMLFLWRAKENDYTTFRLATELSEAEKFDDVAFQYQQSNGGKWKFRLLQAKHKEGATAETELSKIKESDLLSTDDNEAFSLQKYFRSYLKVKQRSKESSIYSVFSESNIEDIIVITNADFNSDRLKNNFEVDQEKDIEADELLKICKDHNTKWQEALVYKLKDQENNAIVRKLKPIFKNTSDFYKLVEELADHILTEKQIDKTGLFKDYYYPLISEVFEKKEGKSEYYLEFQSKFISKDVLSKEATEFRNALIKEITFIQNNQESIKISEEFGKNELPSDDSQLQKLAQTLASVTGKNQELTVSDFEDYHVVLATKVINPKTGKFRGSFINPKKDINKTKLREFFKTEIEKIRRIKKITNNQLKSIEFIVSQDFGESKLPDNDSKLEKLAETLADSIKHTEELKPSLSEEFKNYHVVLAKEVIDIHKKEFHKIFIHGKVKEGNEVKQLSTLSKQFRRILLDKIVNDDQVQNAKDSLGERKIKVSEGFWKEFKPENDPEIQGVQEFVQQIKELLSNNISEKIVKINENSVAKEKINTFTANIKKLAGYILIEKFKKVRFSTSFLHSDELPGNLKNFRDELKKLLGQEKFESIYEYKFDITLKGFKTCEEEALVRKLPILYQADDITEFFNKLKFVVNYPNRIEVNDLLEGEIQNKLKKLDSKAFNSLYQEGLHNWMADRVGTFYTAEKAKTLFQQIQNNLSLWTIDGFNKPYFADSSQEYKFKKYNFLDKFLLGNEQVLYLVFEDIALGHTRIVQTFEQLQKEDSTNIQKYTRSFGHIFLYLKQLDYPDLRSMVYEVLKDKSKFNLIVIECDTQQEIPSLYDTLSKVLLQSSSNTNSKKKIILITKQNDALANKFVKELPIVDGSSFSDLETDSQKNGLKEEAITFQGGQEKTSLAKLIGIDNLDNYLSQEKNKKKLNEIIDIKTLVDLIKNEEINIGHNLLISKGYDTDYYISRQINQQIILNKNKIQKDIKDIKRRISFFVISGTDSGLIDDKIYVFDKDASELARSKFTELCKQNTGSNIHWLKSDSEKLIWQYSQGSISNLVKYREIDKVDKNNYKISKEDLIDEDKLVNQDNKHKIVIISDKAGMGKSTLLTDLSLKIKKNNPNLWVIKIDLNDYTKVLDKELKNRKTKKQNFNNQDINIAVNFLLNDLLGSKEQLNLKTNLEKELFKNSFNGQGKIALLFDGFDEISPDYQDIVIDLLKAFKESKVEKLFVTTRPNMREILESNLEVFSHVLEPFSKENQIEFLTKFWTKKLELKDFNQEHKERLDTYAKSLIKKFSSSINDRVQTFIGIPLQTIMLAEVFQENKEETLEVWQGCKEFVDLDNTNEEPELPEEFALVDLYERFVNRKFYEFHWQDKKGIDFTKTGMQKDFEEQYANFKKRHEILALHRLFSDEDVEKLLSQEEIQKRNIWLEEIKSAERNEGIIDQIIDDKAHFVHLTFAEYFTANFLGIRQSQQYEKTIQELVLTQILIKSDYKMIRTFLHEYNEEKLDRVLWDKDMLALLDKAYSYDDNTADNNNLLEKMIEQNNADDISFLFDVLKQQSYEHTVNELITDSCYTTALDNDYIEIIDILFENVDNKKLEHLLHTYNDCSLLGQLARDFDFGFNFVTLAKTRLTRVQIKNLFDDPVIWDNLQEGNFEFIGMLEFLLDEHSICEILQKYSEEVKQALGGSRGHRNTPDPEWYRILVSYLEHDYEEYGSE